jgi:hypothetical protein
LRTKACTRTEAVRPVNWRTLTGGGLLRRVSATGRQHETHLVMAERARYNCHGGPDMLHSRRTADTAVLKLLASLAALGLLACLAAAAMVGVRTLARSPMLTTSGLLVAGVLAAGLRRLILEIADRRAAEDLGASELTTLTFPPEPRVQRTRPAQLR